MASSRGSARPTLWLREIVELRRMGFRFILLSDDNFYPVTMEDLRLAERQGNTARIESLKEIRRERFELMDKLARLPDDLVFYTQITMEAAEDPEFLSAMNRAKIRGALVGVESVTPEGLKAIFKDFNLRRRQARYAVAKSSGSTACTYWGRSSSGCRPTSRRRSMRRPSCAAFGHRVCAVHHADAVSRAPSTSRSGKRKMASDPTRIAGYPLTRFWLIPASSGRRCTHRIQCCRPIRSAAGPSRSGIGSTASPAIWERASIIKSLRGRVAFVMISKLYRQMYANTGIATDSARVTRSAQWARVLARQCRRLFVTSPMPDLQVPN
jgi:hypothetical protein